jgi:hypothetical protein
MRMESIQISMSKNKPVEINEFVFIKLNRIFMRNTWMSIIEYRFK